MPEPSHPAQPSISKARRVLSRAPRTRSVVAATGLLVICVAPFANAGTGGPLREGVRNGTTTAETQVISNIGSSTGPTGGYSTRQSNLSNSGGGAVYGCRSAAGGSAATPRPQNPCIRANNLNTGYAFEFNASDGPVVGLISAGTGGDAKKPFITNATGVATGLNSDRLDNLDAAQIVTLARTKASLDADTLDGKDSADLQARFAQIQADGDRDETRGLIGDTPVGHPNTGIYTVKFAGDVTKCAVSATITGATSGEITATPAFADNVTTVTVRTAKSDGSTTETPTPDRPFHLTVSC